MKKLLVLFVITLSFQQAKSQAKPLTQDTVYTLSSIPCYDEFGNYYGVVKQYDHIPTKQDSIQFKIDSNREVRKMIDSVRNTPARKPVKKTYPRKNK